MRTDVLFVCTGNRYRSPAAELLLAARTGHTVRAASAGTRAVPGQGLDAATAELVRERGGEPGAFAGTRRLTAAMVARAGLVLGMETAHREAAVRLWPAALRRCFTLREFLRLSAEVPAGGEGLAAAVERAAGRRGAAPPPPQGQDELADPAGLPVRALRRGIAGTDTAVTALAALLSQPYPHPHPHPCPAEVVAR
ncbi:low molecular weight phosphatase family protein [Streptomyces sp. NPDC048172]|uniref:arsenate reductase/protein-tyrosine-phosphatase family protein n=1 Tax=Streptomyces sp. NPDC048172 TaxID=3365505 RepID=UPI003713F036